MQPRKRYPIGDGFTNINVRVEDKTYLPIKIWSLKQGLKMADVLNEALRLLAADIAGRGDQ